MDWESTDFPINSELISFGISKMWSIIFFVSKLRASLRGGYDNLDKLTNDLFEIIFAKQNSPV